MDKSTAVYPLTGDCLLTGPEYLLARNQNCEINIKSAYYIPPTETTKYKNVGLINVPITRTIQPFHDILKELQSKRREHPKGHFMNMLYKELVNSIYGNVVRGMSNKKYFDKKSGKMMRVTATEISNPILAPWTTAFTRSFIAECLHNISKLGGGKVVSVTTDGFITDFYDLETKLLSLTPEEVPMLIQYIKLRSDLTDQDLVAPALEVKKEGIGIVSWTTRGQLGIESGIKATTGFQSSGYTQEELVTVFNKTLSSCEKEFEFTQTQLRGAKDVYKIWGACYNENKRSKV